MPNKTNTPQNNVKLINPVSMDGKKATSTATVKESNTPAPIKTYKKHAAINEIEAIDSKNYREALTERLELYRKFKEKATKQYYALATISYKVFIRQTELTHYTLHHINHLDCRVSDNGLKVNVSSIETLCVIHALYKSGLNRQQVTERLNNAFDGYLTDTVKIMNNMTNVSGATVNNSDKPESAIDSKDVEVIQRDGKLIVTEKPKPKPPAPIETYTRYQLIKAFYDGKYPTGTYFYCTITKKLCHFTNNRIEAVGKSYALTVCNVKENWVKLEPPKKVGNTLEFTLPE